MSNPNSTTQGTKGRGCLFYGCLTLVVLTLILAAGVYFGVRYVGEKFSALIEMNTEETPMELPQDRMSDAAYERLQGRLTKFGESLDSGKAETLELVGTELNALIGRSPDTEWLKDRIYLNVTDDQVQGQVSWPMDDFARIPGMGKLKGRYLNASASLKASLTNDVLRVYFDSLEVKGKPVPEDLMKALRQQNLAENLSQNPEFSKVISKIQSIDVSKDKLTVRSKGTN